MNVAIIGPGHIANVHADELQKLGIKVKVIVGQNLQSAEAFAKAWEVDIASESEDDAFHDGIDVVHICTPPSSHYYLIKKAIENGTHVICEKPLTLCSRQSSELLELAKDKNVIIAVNFNVRYHKVLEEMKDIINSNDFGNIRFLKTSYFQQFHVLPTRYNWRYDSKESGNMRAISEIGSHMIDVISYLSNEKIVAVSAITKNFDPIRYLKEDIMYKDKIEKSQEIEVSNEDVVIVMFKLENHGIGSISLSEISHGKTNEIEIHVDGTNQSLWWNNEKPYHLFIGEREKGLSLSIDSFGGGYTDTFSTFFKEVYRDIKENKRKGNYPNLDDGHYNTVISEAILESSKEDSKWIYIR